jgi:hypothetical protein
MLTKWPYPFVGTYQAGSIGGGHILGMKKRPLLLMTGAIGIITRRVVFMHHTAKKPLMAYDTGNKPPTKRRSNHEKKNH